MSTAELERLTWPHCLGRILTANAKRETSAGCGLPVSVRMTYSVFMNGLKKAGITLNRKMLSEMAIHDPAGFSALVQKVKDVK